MTDAADEELVREMRCNADRLSDCLSSLLRRIEQLELQRSGSGGGVLLNGGIDGATTTTTTNAFAWSPSSPTGGGAYLNGIGSDGPASPTRPPHPLLPPPKISPHRREYLSVDPLTGQRKLVTVVERPLPSGPLRAQSPTQLSGPEAEQLIQSRRHHLLASAYESRIVEVEPVLLEGLELEQICGQFVAVNVTPELSKFIRPGDTLVELDGQPLINKKQLYQQKGAVQLKLVLSDLYMAPMEFYRVLEDYKANNNNNKPLGREEEIKIEKKVAAHKSSSPSPPPPPPPPSSSPSSAFLLPYLSFQLQRGDILQVLSRNAKFFQARKVNDLSTSGFVPNNIRTRPVAMLSPFGRRVIALIGASGVGRRTLKRMLIEHRPHQFASVVPVTSRAPKPGEQHGREYLFERKEDVLQLIRDRQMIEWGEYNDQLYGTTAESIRNVVRSGRVCVLDCTLKALPCLYNAEFMPFVVVVVAPEFEELKQLSHLHGGPPKQEEHIRKVCEQSAKLFSDSEWARQADLVLVNRNKDVSLRRLLDALETLKNEPQWIPLEWLQGGLGGGGEKGNGSVAQHPPPAKIGGR